MGIRSIAARFDFEEKQSTGQDLPRGWYKSTIPGRTLPPEVRFPHYVRGRLTDRQAHDGTMSFSMSLDGGNVAYTYTDGLEIFPDSDYLVVGWVRTSGLRVARTQVRVFLVDDRGLPIDGAVAVSPAMGRPGGPTDGRWHRFEILLGGAAPNALRLQITLSLVQPEIWQPADEQALDRQDIEGECFWDNITVYRVPRVNVGTDVAANVFAPGVKARLITHLEGLDRSETDVVLTVRASSGATKVMRILQPPAPGASARQELVLPDLPPGLYTADLAISSGGEVLMHSSCRFAVLADLPLASGSQLELDATALPPKQWPILLALVRQLRAGGVKLSAWPAVEGDANAAMAAMLSRLHDSGLTTTLVMDSVPPMPDVDTPPRTLIAAMGNPTQELTDAVSLVIARHASRVSYWQLGTGRSDRDMWDTNLAAAYRTGREWTDRLLATKDLLLGWKATYEYDLPIPPRLSLHIPPALAPEEIPDQLAAFAGQVEQVHVTGQDEQMARLDRVADFALRYGYIRAAGVQRVSIDPPWKATADGSIEPTELFLVARTLAAYLGDAVCLGAARLDESNMAMIFRRANGEGVMLLYRRRGQTDEGVVDMDLAPTAYGVDLWGRRFPLERVDGRAVLHPRTVPTLIAGCDAPALALRASLRFEPAALNSTYTKHAARIHFTNPYDQPVSGTIRLIAPEGWAISPRVARFNVGPNGQWSQELTIRFPYSATAGLKRIDVALDIEATDDRRITVPAFLYLSLPQITFDPIITLDDDGQLQVQLCIINYGDAPISFRCSARVSGRASQSSIVRDLPPGAKAVKVFRFGDGADLLGETLYSGLRQIDGNAVLNHADEIR